MRLSVYEPRRFLPTLWPDLDRAMDDFWGLEQLDARKVGFFAAESFETDNEYRLNFDLPGVKKEDIKIEVLDHTLKLSGERKAVEAEGRQSLRERSYGFFERKFTLPQDVDAGKIEAKYQDGVLEVVIPKAPETKPRAIQIT